MKIDIERIKVDEETRIRKEIGDLAKLEESIRQVGLINPLLVDENNALVAGFRRLSACKNLGWKEIEVKVVELGGDELKMLETEAAENLFRKEFTHDEILAVHQRRLEIEESRRHKGWFERFWLWLKRLFQPREEKAAAVKAQPAAAPEAKAEPVQKAEPEQKAEPVQKAEPDQKGETEQKAEPAEKAEPEQKAAEPAEAKPAEDRAAAGGKQEEPQTEPETDPQTAEKVASHARTRTPEITEKDGVRHIKWR